MSDVSTPRGKYRWQLHPHRPNASAIDIAKAALGIWLFVSPAALASSVAARALSSAAIINALAVGGLLLVGGVVTATWTSATTEVMPPIRHRQWSWLTLALAGWLVVSPWVLGYSGQTGMTVNAVIVGVILALLSAVNLVVTRKLGHDHHGGFLRTRDTAVG